MGGILYSDTCSEKCKLLNSTQCEQAMYHSQRERTMQFNNDTAWLKIKALEANHVINYYYGGCIVHSSIADKCWLWIFPEAQYNKNLLSTFC